MSFHSEDSNTSYSNQFNIFINDKETGRQYKSKKQMIFKLENNDNLLEGQSDKEKILKELLNKKREKLTKNRISAKKCRLKKKAYIASLEDKVKNLKEELERNRRRKEETEHSLKSFLIQTIPKKISYYSSVLYPNELQLKTNEDLSSFINQLNRIDREQIYQSMNGNDSFVLHIYIEQVKVLLRNFYSFFEDTQRIYLMNDNNYLTYGIKENQKE